MKKFSACILVTVLLLSGCSDKTDVSSSEQASSTSAAVTSDVTEDTSETSESAETSESSGGLSDQLVPRDIIGDVNGDRYVSELGQVAYVIEGDAKFDGRNKNQAMYGEINLDSKIVDLPSNSLISGQRIMWPDGSNLAITFQYAPEVTPDLEDKFVQDNVPGIKSTIESLQFTSDLCEVTTYSIGGVEYKSIEIKCHNDSMKLHQYMIYNFLGNGLITEISATSAGKKYPVDQLLKNVEFQ